MEKQIICTVCPVGCYIKVVGEGENITSVDGYTCKRGLEYAESEFSHPVRILTTTVKLEDPKNPLIPVRSAKPLPKELIMDCMKQIKQVSLKPPVKRYDVIIENICGSGIDIVATGSAK